MKKSLIALAVLAASGCAMPARSRRYDDQARGHELRALNAGGLEASVKGAKALVPAMCPGDGRAVWITDKATISTNPVAADTIDFFVPGGTRLCDLAFIVSDMDTNGAPALAASIGYRAVSSIDGSLAANATYFQAAAAFGQAAQRIECSFEPIKFEQDVYVSVVITVTAATFAAGTVTMVAGGASEGAK